MASAAEALRQRLWRLLEREDRTISYVVARLAELPPPRRVGQSTVYRAFGGPGVPNHVTLVEIARALNGAPSEIGELVSLRSLASRARPQAAPTAVPARTDLAELTETLYQRFDGRTGRNDQTVCWSFYVGDNSYDDKVVERHRIFVDGVHPLEAVLVEPGSIEELDIGPADLAPKAFISEAPTGSPATLRAYPLARELSDKQLALLTILTHPVTNRGWLSLEIHYHWPRLWDSLRDPTARASNGRLGFVGDVRCGAFEIMSRRRLALDINGKGRTLRKVDDRGWIRYSYEQTNPYVFEFEVTR